MRKIRYSLKSSQDRKKRYAYNNIVFKYFKVGKHIFFKLKANRCLLILGCFPKLEAIYCGPFELLENIGPSEYILAFHASMRVHNVFHVSLLKKYVPNPNHIIDWIVIQVEHKGDFWVEPVWILDLKVKVLKNKAIGLLKF
jgi:hypothetical protein